MKRKVEFITTSHNEILHALINLKKKDIIVNNYKSEAKLSVGKESKGDNLELTIRIDLDIRGKIDPDDQQRIIHLIKKRENMNGIEVTTLLQSRSNNPEATKKVDEYILEYRRSQLLLSRMDVVLCQILFSHMINHPNTKRDGKQYISFEMLHCEYRGQLLNWSKEGIDRTTINAYTHSLNRLSRMKLSIDFTNCKKKYSTSYKKKYKDSQCYVNLFEYSLVYEDGKLIGFTYDLGVFGQLLKKSHRMSSLIVKGIYGVSMKQHTTFSIANYIAKQLYIALPGMGSRRKKTHSISVYSLLDNTMCYDSDGNSKGINHITLLDLDANKRSAHIKYLNESLNRWREITLKESNKIKGITLPEITTKNYSSREPKIVIEIY